MFFRIIRNLQCRGTRTFIGEIMWSCPNMAKPLWISADSAAAPQIWHNYFGNCRLPKISQTRPDLGPRPWDGVLQGGDFASRLFVWKAHPKRKIHRRNKINLHLNYKYPQQRNHFSIPSVNQRTPYTARKRDTVSWSRDYNYHRI